jgi:hypothetical protein
MIQGSGSCGYYVVKGVGEKALEEGHLMLRLLAGSVVP